MANKVDLILTLVGATVVAAPCLLKGALSKFLVAQLSRHRVLDRLGLPKASATTATLRLKVVVPGVSMVLLWLRLSIASSGEPGTSCSPLLAYLLALA